MSEIVARTKRRPRLIGSPRRWMIGTALVSLVPGVSGAAILALINNGITQSGASRRLWWYLALCAVMQVSQLASNLAVLYLSQRSLYHLRMALGRRILATPLRRLEDLGAARLLASLTDDVFALSEATMTTAFVFAKAATIVACLGYLMWLSRTAFLAVVLLLIPGVVLYRLINFAGRRAMARARDQQDALFQHFRSLTEGTKELKLHHRRREVFLTEDLHGAADGMRRHSTFANTVFSFSSTLGGLLLMLAVGVILFADTPLTTGLSFAVRTEFAVALLFIQAPLTAMLGMLNVFARGRVARHRIGKLDLDLGEESQENADAVAAPLAWKRLELRGVTHSYRREGADETFTLGPIDLVLAPGELLFIVGGNGSGKSTLAKLLTGLYRAEAGAILLDGEEITAATVERYRQLFAAVFSDFYLFQRLLGLERGALDDAAKAYLTALQLEHKITVENGQLSTTALSQGQRKRLALLTAYLEDRPIYLFDEWAADQDPSFKEVFYQKLLPDLRRRGKSAVVITHDDRYFHLADRVVKLEDGRIVPAPSR